MSTAHSNRLRTQPIPLRPYAEPGRPESLPLPLTSFVGRDRALAAIVSLLHRSDVRLVTLTGPGGVGKSRIAIRVAEDVAANFRDGIWFVPLASVRDVRLVPSAIAETLRIPQAGDESIEKQIEEFLKTRQALIVLDNVEHLTDAGPLITSMLAACPTLSILVTSREVLRASGEHTFVVPPLTLPDLDDLPTFDRLAAVEAVHLFLERAAAADDSFTLTPENAATVAAICQRLDGLPLAIELAAARIPAFDPASLLNRLENRLTLLTSGPRDAPQRLRTLRDAIGWSYDLITPEEQQLFRRLSVFVGGFTLDAAEMVAADVIDARMTIADGIASLITKSILRRQTVSSGTRFGMLETIREYGVEMLAATGEDTAARSAHAAWCLAFAERASPELNGPNQHIWVEYLESDLGNVRSALDWLREVEQVETALRLANAICWFWTVPGRFHEGRDLFEALIEMPGANASPLLLAAAITTMADLLNWLGDFQHAWEMNQRALGIFRELDDRRNIAMVLRGMGSVAIDLNDPSGAVGLLEESLLHARASVEDWEVAAVTNLLGIAAFALDDCDVAIIRHEEAMEVWRNLGDSTYVAAALTNIGLVAFAADQFERAETAYQEAIDLAGSIGDRYHIVRAIEGFGLLASAGGDPERAARLLGAADGQFARFGTPRRPEAQAVFDRAVTRVHRDLGEARFASAWESGRVLGLEDAIADARATAMAPIETVPTANHLLTRREVEVLHLMATGLTDREIAEHLFISRRTASHHAAAILDKLGVPSRRAAAEKARRLGLVGPTTDTRASEHASRQK